MRITTILLGDGQSLDITKDQNILLLSFSCNTTTVGVFQGNFPKPDGSASDQLPLSDGDSFTIGAEPNSPLDGITLSCTTGNIRVTLGYQ